jgi:DNA-binding SARP family transcriptional activator
VGHLAWFWYSSGLWTEGRGWLEGALKYPKSDGLLHDRARALLGAGILASLQADAAAAITWLEECAEISSRTGDSSTQAYALAYIGVAFGQSGDTRALEPLENAARRFTEMGDKYGLRLCLVALSTFHLIRGNLASALSLSEESARVAREFGLDRELAIALQIHATALLASGEEKRAQALFAESLAALQRDPSMFWIARGLQLIGLVSCRLGEWEKGTRFLGAAAAARESVGASLFAHDRERLEPVVAATKLHLGDQVFSAAVEQGRAMPLEEALAQAITLVLPNGDPPKSGGSGIASGTAPRSAVELQTPGQAVPVLHVRALGELQIFRDGVLVPPASWRYARPRELLLYLLSHPQGRSREQIGVVFWPEASASQVKNNFHVTMHHVRKVLGRADLIRYSGDRYCVAWELGVVFDARDFGDTVRIALRELRANGSGQRANPESGPGNDAFGRLSAAVSCYRGEFLESEGAGDWHLEIRDRLRIQLLDALLLLGGSLFASARYREAGEFYTRALSVEPLREDALRQLMLSHARAGLRGEALRRYDRHVALLKSEMLAGPEEESRALYERLRRAEPV